MTSPAPRDDLAALTCFIETHFHERHRMEMPDLAAMAALVEQRHAKHPHAPHGLSALLPRMIGTMEVNMKKEERILFPAIRRGGLPGIEEPIADMRKEHDDLARDIAEIRRLTDNLALPAEAYRTWNALYTSLSEFPDALVEHIQFENDALFSSFETAVQHD